MASACPAAAPFAPLRTRAELGLLLNELNFTSGAELGVQAGEFSRIVLTQWPRARHYWLVDVWRSQKNYDDVANVGDTLQTKIMRKALSNVRTFRSRTHVHVCRDFTLACATTLPDASLDFVYVDARHDYKGVAEDLRAWWPKLRCGGIFAGHDFVDQDDVDKGFLRQDWTKNYDGTVDHSRRVARGAIVDFARAHDRQLVITYRETNWNTWLLRK